MSVRAATEKNFRRARVKPTRRKSARPWITWRIVRVAASVMLVTYAAYRAFDLVVSDIVMPGRMDGLGLARAIKKKRPDLPILLATGYSAAAQSVLADFPILRKPYQMHELSRALAEILPGEA